MHLLPGGGVPRVHRAWSPVPPRPPPFATPRSVRQFAAVAANAYPLRRPPNAWSPGVPALPGACYWLVARGSPEGWRGGCLALGLVSGAMRHYCLGRCSALVVCVRRSRPVRGGWGRCRVLCLPCFPLPAPRFLRCVWRAVLSGCPLSSLAGMPFHAVCAFRGLGLVALLVFPASPLCVSALALSRCPHPPPLPGLVWCAHPARSRCWALVVPFHSVRAPPACPASVPCSVWLAGGGAARSRFPLPGLELRAPRGVGAGVGTRHQPQRAHSCKLALRAGLARCRGGTRAPGGGVPLGWVRGARGRALSQPRPLVLSACGRGPLPTGCGCGGCGHGEPPPTPQRSLLRAGFARSGGGMRVPGGGASCLGAGHPGSGALPHPTTRLFGRAAGAHYPLAVGARGASVGTCHQPHSARSCELALRAVGAA